MIKRDWNKKRKPAIANIWTIGRVQWCLYIDTNPTAVLLMADWLVMSMPTRV